MDSEAVQVQVGKAGITAGLVSELGKHFKAGKTVSVRFLKAFIKGKDRRACASEIEHKTGVKGRLVGNVLKMKK